MKKWIIKTLFLLFWIVVPTHHSPLKREISSKYQISKNVSQLVDWETKANAISTRSNMSLKIMHYEIPLTLLLQDKDSSLDPKLEESLVFEKDGEKYVRWIINPEDKKWHFQVKKFLDFHNLNTTPKEFFTGYLTASRSLILLNPNNGASFSLKVSTDMTGGSWKNKKQTWLETKKARGINNWVKEVTEHKKINSFKIMDEPLAFGIKEIDQGMILRSLNDLPDDGHYYIPGFSLLHEKEGARIAKLNGATNVADFWDKHYNQPLAHAMAELFAYTGLWYDSPHSQNFLVELDNQMHPTGRIIFRDLGDTFLLKDFIENTDYSSLINLWEPEFIQVGLIKARVGLLHGNLAPRWMTTSEYENYAKHFYQTFEKDFSDLTNIPPEELAETRMTLNQYSFARKEYKTTSFAWIYFLDQANCMAGKTKTIEGIPCKSFNLKNPHIYKCNLLIKPFI